MADDFILGFCISAFCCSFSEISLGRGNSEKEGAERAGSVSDGPGVGCREQEELRLFQPGDVAAQGPQLYLYFQTL